MANYPNSVPSFTTKVALQTIDPAHINSAQDEIVALGTQLLTPASWTPAITGSGGGSGQTYTVQVGSYLRFGKAVLAYGRVTLSAVGTVTTTVRITGFPVACANTTNLNPSLTIGYIAGLTTAVVSVSGFMIAGTAVADLYIRTGAAGNPTGMAQADLSATTDIIFSVVYLT